MCIGYMGTYIHIFVNMLVRRPTSKLEITALIFYFNWYLSGTTLNYMSSGYCQQTV